MKTKEICTDIEKSLNAYIDGELTDTERESISSHLLSCRSCRDEYEQLLQVNYMLSEFDAPAFSPHLQDRLKSISEEKRQSLFRPLQYLKPLPVAASIIITIFAALFLGNNLNKTVETALHSDEQSFAQESLYTVWQEIHYEE